LQLCAVILPWAPGALILILATCWTGYYNYRLTGQATLMPYAQNTRDYSVTPLFLWQPLKPKPPYHHREIRAYHTQWAVPAYLRERTPDGYAGELASRLRGFLGFYLGPILIVCLPVLP